VKVLGVMRVVTETGASPVPANRVEKNKRRMERAEKEKTPAENGFQNFTFFIGRKFCP
jgi:hypothetical protein